MTGGATGASEESLRFWRPETQDAERWVQNSRCKEHLTRNAALEFSKVDRRKELRGVHAGILQLTGAETLPTCAPVRWCFFYKPLGSEGPHFVVTKGEPPIPPICPEKMKQAMRSDLGECLVVTEFPSLLSCCTPDMSSTSYASRCTIYHIFGSTHPETPSCLRMIA